MIMHLLSVPCGMEIGIGHHVEHLSISRMNYVKRRCNKVHAIERDGIKRTYRCELPFSHNDPVFPVHYIEHKDGLFTWMEKREKKGARTDAGAGRSQN